MIIHKETITTLLQKQGRNVTQLLDSALQNHKPKDVLHMDILYVGLRFEQDIKYVIDLKDCISTFFWPSLYRQLNSRGTSVGRTKLISVLGGMTWLFLDAGPHFM